MTAIVRVDPTIEVHTPLGKGRALFIIDYSLDINSVWLVRLASGIIKHFYSDDIRIYDNAMNGNGTDVELPTNWKK
jgi:hypothetical protein